MGEKRGLRALQAWCRKVTEGYKNVSVTDMSMSWKDGLAFCAIIHHFRPDLVDFDSLTKDNILLNNRLAFTVAEQSLGIPALLDEEDMVRYSEPDKLSIATYVSQYYQFFEGRNRGTASNNLHTSKLSMKRPFNDRAFAPQALPAKIPGVAPRGFFKDEKCSSCGNRVYILERLMVDSKLYHRTCFTCNKCQTLLRPGAYAASDVEGKFECIECPSEESVSSPESNGPVPITVDEDSKDSGTFEADTEPQPNSASELKLSNSFISARKKFFEHSLEDAKLETPQQTEEECMKLSIDEGILRDVSENKTDNKEIRDKLAADDSGRVYSSRLSVNIKVNDNNSNLNDSIDDDLETPVNKPAFDYPEGTENQVNQVEVAPKVPESEIPQDTEAPKLPTSEIPQDSTTSNNETVSTTSAEPPLKTPRKMKRLSMDASSWKASEADASALPSDSSTPTRSMSPTLSLPIISSVSPVSPLRKGRSSGLQAASKSSGPVLPPTQLTSADKSPKSLELKGAYQSPLSPTYKWKPYEKRDSDVPEVKDDRMSPTKPKVPEKPAFIAAMSSSNVPTTSPDSKESLPKEEDHNEDLNPFGDDLSSPEVTEPPKKVPEPLTEVPKPPTEIPKPPTEIPKPPKEEVPEPPKKVLEPPKEVKVVVKVKPARPPKPVIKETKPAVPPPTSIPKEIEYPDDLNPFGDDEETEEEKNEYPDDLNPFDDEEDQPNTPVNDNFDPTPSFQSTSSQSLSKIEAYNSKLNPFGDSDDEDNLTDAESLSRDSRYFADMSHQSLPTTPRSSSRQSRTLGRHKKRAAPLPPSLQPGRHEGHHSSDFNISLKGSPSPSRSSLQGSLRGSPRSSKKAAPRPPILPPPLASTPKKLDLEADSTVNSQDLSGKAQKEQNNKTMKELVDSVPVEDDQSNTFGYWKKKKRPAPSVPIPPRRQIKMIPVKEIQSELVEIEVKQKDLESQGRDLETMIRDFNQSDEEEASVDEEELILQLFELVNQKNILFRRQAELMYIKRSQSLEQEQADIEYKYRLIASKPEKLKSEEEKQKEEHLLQRLIEIVELRNEIVESMDMDRQRVQDEDMSIQEQMAQRQGQLQERLSPDSTSVSEPIEDDEKAKKEKKKHKLKFIKRDKSKDVKDKSKDKAKDKEIKDKEIKDKKEAKAKAKEEAKTKAKEDEGVWKFAKKDKKKT